MRIACFDGFSGASGDMILGALLDAGADLDRLREQLRGLGVAVTLTAERIKKQGLAATQFGVEADDPQPHRHLHHIVDLIQRAGLPAGPAERAQRIFGRLADAEARVHGTTRERIHFHEVGAVDAIVDIVGACLALDDLGIERIHSAPLALGSGTVTCAHGTLPIPAPATAALLAGFPIATCDEVGELTTPTGAAILTTLAESWGPLPALTVRASGWGAGRRDGRQRPNVLRVLIGDLADVDAAPEVVVLETHIDDQNPEITAHALQRVLDGGALDAYAQPVFMKKGRVGTLLTVLCERSQAAALEDQLFRETSTFGIRRTIATRATLQRDHVEVDACGHRVRIKIGRRHGTIVTAAPEFEDCRRVADTAKLPVKEVVTAAITAWQVHASTMPEGAGHARPAAR